jgi:hypothetical protein
LRDGEEPGRLIGCDAVEAGRSGQAIDFADVNEFAI